MNLKAACDIIRVGTRTTVHTPNLSWNEIRARATAFSRDWSGATREQADKQSFWNDFFDIPAAPSPRK